MPAIADYPLPQQRSGRVHGPLTLPGPGFQKLAQTGGGGGFRLPLNFAPLYPK